MSHLTHAPMAIQLPLSLLEAFESTTTQELPGTPGSGGTPGGGAGEGGEAPQGSLLDALFPAVMIGAVIWFLVFAPEKKARKQRQAMLDAVQKGDKVITTGGLHGKVEEIREREVVIKAGDSRLTFSRSSIHEIVGDKPSED